MAFGTGLRTHLHAWLHPRDPLLEAWRDDPFVEWAIDRSKREATSSPRFMGSDIAEIVFIFSLILLLVVSIFSNQFALGPTSWLIVLVMLLALYGKALMRWVFNADKKVASDAIPLNDELELWLCGVRGRDMAKKYVADVGAERIWVIVVPAFLIVMVPSYVYVTWTSWSVGLPTLVCYALLLIWAVVLLRWVGRSTFNPFKGDLPKYFAVLKDADEPMNLLALICVPGSFVIVAALILDLVMNSPGVVANQLSLPISIRQIVGLCLASVMAYCVPTQDGERLRNELEKNFERVDQDFDLHVRREILKDADAERIY